MIEVVALRSKAYAYLDDDGSENRKAKGNKTKSYVWKFQRLLV